MSDLITPNDPLDRRIRDLVAQAVADTPNAPELTEIVPEATGSSPRNWYLAAAAAAVVGLGVLGVVIATGGHDAAIVPATVPSVATTQPTPTTGAPPTTAAPAQTTVPAGTTTPAATETTQPDGTTAPTGATSPPESVAPTSVAGGSEQPGDITGGPLTAMVAGPDGIVQHGDGVQPIDDRSFAIAIQTFSGVLVQEERGEGGQRDPARTVPLLIDGDGTPWTPVPDGVDPSSVFWTIDDAAIVDGQVWVVYTLGFPADSASPSTTPEGYTIPPETKVFAYAAPLLGESAPVELGQVGGWEYGVTRLQLSTDGGIVAAQYVEASIGYFRASLPGGTMPPTADELGIDSESFDCTTCPSVFGITPDGRVTWLEYGTIVVNQPDGSQIRIDVSDQFVGDQPPNDLDVSADVEGTSIAVVNFGMDPAPSDPLLVTIGPDGSHEVTSLPGHMATVNPPSF